MRGNTMIHTGLRFAIALGFLFGMQAIAEEASKTSINLKEVTHSNSISNAEEIDQLITNKSLRALSGSKSRWSFGSTFTYNGGALSKPLSENRPNIAEASAITDKSELSGQVSGKFNINVQ